MEDQNILHKQFERFKDSPWVFFVNRFRVTTLILVAIFLLGVFAMITIPRELEPEVKIPYAIVTVLYPGAAPNDVMELVTKKMETRVAGLDGIDKISSTSSDSFSMVMVQFNAKEDLESSFSKLRTAAADAKVDLPDNAEDPTVTELRIDDSAVVTFNILGNYTVEELRKYAETIQDEIKKIPGVSNAQIIGDKKDEIWVSIDRRKLQGYSISTDQVASAIKANNLTFPLGYLKTDKFNYSVRIDSKFTGPPDLRSLPIGNAGGQIIYLGDVAQVVQRSSETKSIARLAKDGQEPQTALSILLFKKTGANIVQVVDKAKARVEVLQSTSLPTDVSIEATQDESNYIRESLSTLSVNGLETVIIVIALLFLCLGFYEAVICGLVVPFTFLASFFLLQYFGATINTITLFSLILTLGMLVDASIVMTDAIYSYRQMGMGTYEAAVLAIRNYRWPIISGTLTTVAAFIPMFFISGIMGEFIVSIPLTVTITLMSALFLAILLLPAVNNAFFKDKKATASRQWLGRAIDRFKIRYEKILAFVLNKPRFRSNIIKTAWLLFVLAMLMPITGVLQSELFPKQNSDYFSISVKLPDGARLEETEKIIDQVEAVAREVPEAENVVTNIGTGTSQQSFFRSSIGQENIGSVFINLIPKKARKRASFDIIDDIRPKLANIYGADIKVDEAEAGPSADAPITVKVYGEDLDKLKDYAVQVQKIVENVHGAVDVDNDIVESAGEFSLRLKYDRLASFGLSAAQVANTVRTALYGYEASEITENGDDIKIIVKYQEDRLQNMSDLEQVIIHTPTGEDVPLGTLIDSTIQPGLAAIERSDQKNVIRITGQVDGTTSVAATKKIKEEVNKIDFPINYGVDFGGDFKEITDSFNELYRSLIIGVILIAFILVLQFNSFSQSLIILYALPLAIIGVFPGLYLVGQKLSFPAMIGLVSLGGIVVNNAIILIDAANYYRTEEGLSIREAVLKSAVSRVQPIFLTTITTVAGILPLAMSEPIWGGLGFVIVFGLSTSTVLTLLIIPIMYASTGEKKERKKVRPASLAQPT